MKKGVKMAKEVIFQMFSVEELIDIIKGITDGEIHIEPQSPLIGGKSLIDSMVLVQICLALEDKSHSEGFLFDWTSEKAMSTLTSIFKTPKTLAEEYNRQLSQSLS